MRHPLNLYPFIALSLALVGCGQSRTKRLGLPPLASVGEVNLERYAGTWYEIASYPNRFQEGCTGTTATYSLNDDGSIKVKNVCREGALDGPEMSAEGRARVPNPDRNAELEVSFLGRSGGTTGHPARPRLSLRRSRTAQSRLPLDSEPYAHPARRDLHTNPGDIDRAELPSRTAHSNTSGSARRRLSWECGRGPPPIRPSPDPQS